MDIIPIIREAAEADMDAVTEMCMAVKEAILSEHGGSDVSSNNREEIKAYTMKYLKYNTRIIFVALIGDEIVGFIMGDVKSPNPVFKPQVYGSISCLYVKKVYADIGVSRMLVFKIEEWLRARGIEFMEVRVRAKNVSGMNLWSSLGFTENAIIMKRNT